MKAARSSLSVPLAVTGSLLVLSSTASGQLAAPGLPPSWGEALDEVSPPVYTLPVPDVAGAEAFDRERGWPHLRYGVEVPFALGLERHGLWSELSRDRSSLIWRSEIASPGAFSLGVVFEEFDLPSGGAVYLYSPDRSRLLGAYTEANELESGGLAIQPLAGDRAIVEYVHPIDATEEPRLGIGAIVHDYRNVFEVASGVEQRSAPCFLDVNCPVGASSQDVKRSVLETLNGGTFGCSAALVNNTANDGTPYVYTASHCDDMTGSIWMFNYERTRCNAGPASMAQTLSGAVRLANSSFLQYDATLYRLSQAPPASYKPYYAGWSRSASPKGPCVSISHPGGRPKSIAIDEQDPTVPPLSAFWGGRDPSYWWHVQWELGSISQGSSGSPLFDRDERLIGSLSVANILSACAFPGRQECGYGRLSGFWNAKNLGTWLDPLGTGALALDGLDPFAPFALPFNGSGVNPAIYTSLSAPAQGTTWTAEIDATTFPGATLGVIAGYAAPQPGTLYGFGELLVDPLSPRLFLSSAPVTAGRASHALAIPIDPALGGVVAYTQGFLLGTSWQATNGIELILD